MKRIAFSIASSILLAGCGAAPAAVPQSDAGPRAAMPDPPIVAVDPPDPPVVPDAGPLDAAPPPLPSSAGSSYCVPVGDDQIFRCMGCPSAPVGAVTPYGIYVECCFSDGGSLWSLANTGDDEECAE